MTSISDQMIKGQAIGLNLWDVTFGPPCSMCVGIISKSLHDHVMIAQSEELPDTISIKASTDGIYTL